MWWELCLLYNEFAALSQDERIMKIDRAALHYAVYIALCCVQWILSLNPNCAENNTVWFPQNQWQRHFFIDIQSAMQTFCRWRVSKFKASFSSLAMSTTSSSWWGPAVSHPVLGQANPQKSNFDDRSLAWPSIWPRLQFSFVYNVSKETDLSGNVCRYRHQHVAATPSLR